MKTTILFVLLFLCPLCLHVSYAQESKEEPSYSYFFLKAGFSSSDLFDIDERNNTALMDSERRNGITGGLGVSLAVCSWFAIRPELLYVQKGMSGYDDDMVHGLRLHHDVRLDYIELPLLFSFTVPTRGALRGNMYFGGYGSWNFDRRHRQSYVDPFRGETITYLPDESLKDFIPAEAGACVGGGFGVDMGGLMLMVDARYTHGLTPLFDGSDYLVNRCLSVTVGVAFTGQ